MLSSKCEKKTVWEKSLLIAEKLKLAVKSQNVLESKIGLYLKQAVGKDKETRDSRFSPNSHN